MSCQYLATGEYTCDNQSTQEEVKRMVLNTSEVKPEKFTNSCTQSNNTLCNNTLCNNTLCNNTLCNTVENFTNNTHQHIIYHSNGEIHSE